MIQRLAFVAMPLIHLVLVSCYKRVEVPIQNKTMAHDSLSVDNVTYTNYIHDYRQPYQPIAKVTVVLFFRWIPFSAASHVQSTAPRW